MTRQLQPGLKIMAGLLLACVLIFQTSVAPASAAAATVKASTAEVQLVFDGKTLVLPQGQYIFAIKGTNYVPLRFFSYALQKTVNWDAKKATVSVRDPSKQEAVLLNERLLNSTGKAGQASSKGGVKIAVSPIKAKFVFGGKEQALPEGQTAYLLNGTIYVPVRFMSQSVGTAIKWDKSGKITGESAAYKTEQGGKGTDNGSGGTNGSGTGTGTGNGGTPSAPTYASITAATESSLYTLKASCEEQLTPLGFQLVLSEDTAEKKRLVTQMNGIIDDCTTKFEAIVKNTEQQLTAGNFDTAVIADYRKAFNDYIAEGKALLEGMNK